MWPIFEACLVVLVAVVIVTQVIVPPFFGARYFWLFRKSEQEILKKEDQLAGLNDQERLKTLDDEVKLREKELAGSKPAAKKSRKGASEQSSEA